jgi:hypothetical protein
MQFIRGTLQIEIHRQVDSDRIEKEMSHTVTHHKAGMAVLIPVTVELERNRTSDKE